MEAVRRQELLLATVQQGVRQCKELISLPDTPQSGGRVRNSSTIIRIDNVARPQDITNSSQTFTLRLTERRNYKPYCGCSCHKLKRLQSSSLLGGLIGSIFIGYVGLPTPFTKCDQKNCCLPSSTKVYVFYVFPGWFLDYACLLNVKLSLAEGPEMLIRCLHIRQFRTTPSFQALAQLQQHHLQKLIIIRKASVLDVDEFGRSLLDVRLLSFLALSISK